MTNLMVLKKVIIYSIFLLSINFESAVAVESEVIICKGNCTELYHSELVRSHLIIKITNLVEKYQVVINKVKELESTGDDNLPHHLMRAMAEDAIEGMKHAMEILRKPDVKAVKEDDGYYAIREVDEKRYIVNTSNIITKSESRVAGFFKALDIDDDID